MWQGSWLGFVAETGSLLLQTPWVRFSAFVCALLPAFSTIFLVFFCALLPTCCLFSLSLSRYVYRVSSSCSFICAAVAICYYSHKVCNDVKTTTTTTNNICSQVRHAYVTKGTYAFIYIFIYTYLVPLHTILLVHIWYTCSVVPSGTSLKSQWRLWQLEHISPPSSTNSKRLWTRAEVNGGANKGPPQTPSGPKSMVFRWRSRDEAQSIHIHQHAQGNK